MPSTNYATGEDQASLLLAVAHIQFPRVLYGDGNVDEFTSLRPGLAVFVISDYNAWARLNNAKV